MHGGVNHAWPEVGTAHHGTVAGVHSSAAQPNPLQMQGPLLRFVWKSENGVPLTYISPVPKLYHDCHNKDGEHLHNHQVQVTNKCQT